MRNFLAILILTSFFSLQSCVVYNATKKSDAICDIHNIKMQKKLVKTRYGRLCPDGLKLQYMNAKSIQCMGCKRPLWPKNRLAIKYSCRECTKLKKEDKK
jgi:hypothetical protein